MELVAPFSKEQSADDLRGSDSCKKYADSTTSMSYPDIVLNRTWQVLEAFRAIEAALVKHDNNMKDYSLVVGLITITLIIQTI